MNTYSRQDVLRILQISSRQLLGWERAGLIAPQQSYSFQDLGQLRIVRSLRADDVPAAYIRHSIVAMQAVAGMANPLLEASLVRAGSRLLFRHHGAVVDPIRRQLLFDFERYDQAGELMTAPAPYMLRRAPAEGSQAAQELFLAAVEAEEAGDKQHAIELYEQIIALNGNYAPAYINLGTIYFHLRSFEQAEKLYRRATEVDPSYVLAFFDLGNVLDELQRHDDSIAAYHQAVVLAPRYADAHYNLALAYERKGLWRPALSHWKSYVKLDANGPWAEHAEAQIRRLLEREKLAVVWRADHFVPRGKGVSALQLVQDSAKA